MRNHDAALKRIGKDLVGEHLGNGQDRRSHPRKRPVQNRVTRTIRRVHAGLAKNVIRRGTIVRIVQGQEHPGSGRPKRDRGRLPILQKKRPARFRIDLFQRANHRRAEKKSIRSKSMLSFVFARSDVIGMPFPGEKRGIRGSDENRGPLRVMPEKSGFHARAAERNRKRIDRLDRRGSRLFDFMMKRGEEIHGSSGSAAKMGEESFHDGGHAAARSEGRLIRNYGDGFVHAFRGGAIIPFRPRPRTNASSREKNFSRMAIQLI